MTERRQLEKQQTKTRGRDIDMLHGALGKKTLIFALPLAVTGILQQLFNAVDIAVIGQFCGKEAMAAVGSNAPVVGLMVTFFIGLSLGSNVVISRFTGQRRNQSVSKGVHTSILIALIFGFGVALIGEVCAVPLLHLLGVPKAIFGKAILYLRIYMIGLPVIFLYNFESAIYRSQGDTRTPLICLTISGVINVGLNLFFVLVIGMDVAGVACATVMANGVSSGLLLAGLIRRQGSLIQVRRQNLRISGSVLREIFRIGLPAGLQSTVFSLSNLCLQSAINSLGSDVIAASAAAFNIEIFAFYILNSFGQAATTFIGQNYGANQYDRCRRVTRICLIQDMIFTVALAFGILAMGRPLLHLFNGDPEVIEIGMIRLRYILSAEALCVIIEVFSGTLRGYGRSLSPALLALICICGIRITWVFLIFPMNASFETLVMIYPISWAANALGVCLTYLLYLNRGIHERGGKEKPGKGNSNGR